MARHLFALFGFVLALGAPGLASAHAYLERSNPAGNTIVETAPRRIQLWFTERPEPRFSDVTVYTSDGRQVPHGPLSVVPDDPRSLVFDLDPTPNGTYTVAWKTLSADDGHTSAGAFAYAVGLDQPAPTAASIFVPAGQASETGRPNPLAVLGRWLGYVGAALVGGGPFFLAFVLWPAVRRKPDGKPAPSASSGQALSGAKGQTEPITGTEVARRLTRLHRTGLALALIGAVARLLGQAVAIGGTDPAALGSTLLDLLGTRSGLLFGCRLLALVAVAVALRALARRCWAEQRLDWPVPLALLGSAGLLLAQSLGAHAAAQPIWTSFTVAADWVHLAAMIVWLGGLALLGLVVPAAVAERPEHERPALLAGVVGRFSQITVWCIGLLVLTGLYQSWIEVGQLEGFTRTAYGEALLVKLLLIVPLLLLGALNLLVARPGLARTASAHARQATRRFSGLAHRLRLAVRGELLLGAAVLLVTGVLTNLPPAREALIQMGRPQTRSAQMGTLKATLTVDPAVAGLNTYDVALADSSGRAITDAEQVTLRFRHTQMDMGEIEAVLQPRGDGHYTAQGSFVSMAGLWDVEVHVRLPGQEDAITTLEIPAADPSAAAQARASQTPSLGTSLLLGLELLVAALALALGARRLRLPLARPLNTLVPRLGAVGLGVAGLYFLTLGIMNDLTPTAALANPIPPTRASLARGKEIYEQNCQTCHGEYGRGDGPAGRLLHPRPADLQQHVTQHTEGQLYWWISKGFPGSAMPAWEDRLSEEDRWNVLNYIVAAFGPGGQAAGAGPPGPAGASAAAGALAAPAASPSPAPAGLASLPAGQSGPGANGSITLTQPAGELNVRLTLTPRALGTSDYEAALTDASGQPYASASRVALKFAMRGMSHGLYDQEMAPQGDGRYLASSNNLFMAGGWWAWVVVDLPDGSVRDALFAFDTGPPQPAAAQSAIQSGAPPGVQLVNVVAYPTELSPSQVTLNPGGPVVIEAALADGARCGGRLRVPSLGLEAPFSADGFARLELSVDQPLTLRTTCGAEGLDLN